MLYTRVDCLMTGESTDVQSMAITLASSSKVGWAEVASGTTGQTKERARPLSLHPVCTRLAYLVYTPYTHISR